MSRTRKTTVSTLGATLGAVALVGSLTGVASASARSDNGVADKSAQEIAAASKSAFEGATSVHVKTASKDMPEGLPSAMDLKLDRDGNCSGSVARSGRGGYEIIKQGDKVWIRPDAAWVKDNVPAEDQKALSDALKGGKYLYGTTADDTLKEASQVCDLSAVQERLNAHQPASGLKKAGKAEVNGAGAVEITGIKGGLQAQVWVATDGKPYPLRGVAEGTTGEGKKLNVTTTYSDYDKPLDVKTPSAGQSTKL
ncbi:hypothetical protein ACQB60_44945 [Actinomycetota bacterium Odt1-20B]